MSDPHCQHLKVQPELAKILREAAREVSKWPTWKRSLDPIGEAGRAKYAVSEVRNGD